MTLGYEGYSSRVHAPETARLMFDVFASAGYRDVDTAHGYGGGSCEQISPISAAVAKAASLADTAELLACRAAAEIDEAAGQNQFTDGKS